MNVNDFLFGMVCGLFLASFMVLTMFWLRGRQAQK